MTGQKTKTVTCPHCKGTGKIKELSKDRIGLLSCMCGHGGAWHENRYGRCGFPNVPNYPHCNCQNMIVSFAIINGERLASEEYQQYLTLKEKTS